MNISHLTKTDFRTCAVLRPNHQIVHFGDGFNTICYQLFTLLADFIKLHKSSLLHNFALECIYLVSLRNRVNECTDARALSVTPGTWPPLYWLAL